MYHYYIHSRRNFSLLLRLAIIFSLVFLIVLPSQPVLASPTGTTAESTAQSTTQAANLASSPLEKPVAARLSAGLQHSAMINYDGKLYTWGDNSFGQLGLGSLDYSDAPAPVELPGTVAAISLGAYHTLAVLSDGSLYAFGRNAFGQLGNGSTDKASLPVLIKGLPPIKAVAAGAWHSLALGADGSVWAWGNNSNFQVGNADSETIKDGSGNVLGSRCTKPVQIISGNAAAIAAGGLFSMYLDRDGKVYSWGDNTRGQLGDGTTQQHANPVEIPGLAQITMIASGYQHCLALSRQKGYDALYVWGDDALGQLGIGSDPAAKTFRNLPQRLDITNDKDPANDQIVTIAAGYSQSAAITPLKVSKGAAQSTRQQLVVWGNNSSGQLGLGHMLSQNKPVVLSGTFDGWTGDNFLPFDAIAMGGNHTLLLSSKGLLAASGLGGLGQIGNMSLLDRNRLTPVDIADVIRPAWLAGASLSARYSADKSLVIRWPQAQDNQVVTGYRVVLRRSDGKIQEIDAGSKLSVTIPGADPELAYEIKVLAYDADSVQAEAATLSSLAEYVLPAEALKKGALPVDYFPETSKSVWQIGKLTHHWLLDPRGVLRALDVPWDVSSIYGKDKLPLQINWQAFTFAAFIAGLLLLLALWDARRRNSKQNPRKKNLPVNAAGHQQAG